MLFFFIVIPLIALIVAGVAVTYIAKGWAQWVLVAAALPFVLLLSAKLIVTSDTRGVTFISLLGWLGLAAIVGAALGLLVSAWTLMKGAAPKPPTDEVKRDLDSPTGNSNRKGQ
jgi:hypothetical protein